MSEQKKAVETRKKELESTELDIKAKIDALQRDMAEQNSTYSRLLNDIEGLEFTKLRLKEINHALTDEITEKQAQVDAMEALQTTAMTQRHELELAIGDLEIKKVEVEESIPGLKATFSTWKGKIDAYEVEFANLVAEKEKRLKLLDAKALALKQKLDLQDKVEADTRLEFANRQRRLDEWEKNLRVRESKVELGENKLINNANLLNL